MLRDAQSSEGLQSSGTSSGFRRPGTSRQTGSITTCASARTEIYASAEIWDSREQFEAFGERLMPLLAEAGIDPGEPEVIEIHNIIKR